jgi:hypothetical protein
LITHGCKTYGRAKCGASDEVMATGMAVREGIVFRENRHLRSCLAAELSTQGRVQASDWLLSRNPKGFQGTTQSFGGEVFLKAQLRMRMDLAADLDDTLGGSVDRT